MGKEEENPCLSNPCPVERLCTPDLSWDTFNCDGCEHPLGMEDGTIKDDQISASSYADNISVHKPKNGRLNKKRDAKGIGGWAAGSTGKGEHIQIDLGIVKVITKVATQGRQASRVQYVTKYSLSYSNDGENWSDYEGDCVKLVVNQCPSRLKDPVFKRKG
ncbi:hypothetical protein QZH41_019475 [Actinostola sp. cb2023]|nr:hypothetical protein QZH41_019475 [Actinostola sp. cb2023]